MKKLILFFLKHILFLLLYFAFTRLIYLLYHLKELRINEMSFGEAVFSFSKGFRLDLSTSIYILLIPFLFISLQFIINKNWVNRLQHVYFSIILLFYSLLAATEMGIYEEWKTKLHYKALLYLTNPSEINFLYKK